VGGTVWKTGHSGGVNAGADITTIQALLGHSRLNTTMTYARVHDKTVARDYYEAMAIIEKQSPANLNQETVQQPHTNGHHPGVNGNAMKLLRLVAALEVESLTESQQAVVAELQQELLSLAA
jgi:hypothetical protein